MTEQIKMNIPIDQLKDQICKCGNTVWVSAMQLKIIPPLYSQTSRYEHLMLPYGFFCTACGNMIPLRPTEDASKILTFPGKEN